MAHRSWRPPTEGVFGVCRQGCAVRPWNEGPNSPDRNVAFAQLPQSTDCRRVSSPVAQRERFLPDGEVVVSRTMFRPLFIVVGATVDSRRRSSRSSYSSVRLAG